MVALSGEQHHFAVRLREDKAKVLSLVSQGIDPKKALAMCGRKPELLRNWLSKDLDFANSLEDAAAEGRKSLEQALGQDKFEIDFATFAQEFMNSRVFPHHQAWVDVLEGRELSLQHPSITYEPANPNRLLVNVPPEHAKSTKLTVEYPTYRICMNPNVRIVIISQTQKRAKEFLYSIKQRLTEEPWAKMQQVYGPAEGWQSTSAQWTQDQIYLQRDSGEKDPTVQAIGWGQQIYGARADLIIIDDIVSTSNAHQWENQLQWLQKMDITRLGKTGKLIIAGTRVSSVDFYKELRNPDHWTGGKTPFTYLAMPAVLEFADDPEDWVTLWPKSDRPWDGTDDEPDEDGLYPKWDGPTLHARRSEVTPSTWALVYQQQDVEEDAIFPMTCVHGSINRLRKPGPINPDAPGHPSDGQWVTIMGLDPAMSGKTAGIIYSVDRLSGRRMVLDAHNMSDPTPQKIRSLIESWVERYQPMELRIEINAHQKAYELDTELNQYLASNGVRLNSHFTGRNKWDTAFGVAAMSTLFGSMRDGKFQGDNLLELPDHQNNEHFKALINQLITWKPETKGPTDLVMALWFCEIRARELIQQGLNRQSHLNNRWATRRGNANKFVVNLNDVSTEDYTMFL